VDETSAGGLVVDGSGPVPVGALIGKQDRRGRLLWSLPKGHLEMGETARDAAVREVAEETGINGEIIGVLGTIDFWFVADRRRIHKTVHHFLLNAVGGSLSDEDVEVTEVAWVPLTELTERLAYPDERELIGVAAKLLDERSREEQSVDERSREEQSTAARSRAEHEQGSSSSESGERPCA
jgi:ADP-ribose pyrophosphatase YjhB (NUDIX family)